MSKKQKRIANWFKTSTVFVLSLLMVLSLISTVYSAQTKEAHELNIAKSQVIDAFAPKNIKALESSEEIGTLSESIVGNSDSKITTVINVSDIQTINYTITVKSGNVKFTGGGTIQWSTNSSLDHAIVVEQGANVTFENVTLDGGNNRFADFPYDPLYYACKYEYLQGDRKDTLYPYGGSYIFPKKSALVIKGTVTLGRGVNVQNFKAENYEDVQNGMTWDGTWDTRCEQNIISITGSDDPNIPAIINVTDTITMNETIMINSGYVKFTGGGTFQWNWDSASENLYNAIVVEPGYLIDPGYEITDANHTDYQIGYQVHDKYITFENQQINFDERSKHSTNVTFENITLDGGGKTFERSALVIEGTATLGNNATVKNFITENGSARAFPGRAGVIEAYAQNNFYAGTLYIRDNALITGNQCRVNSGIVTAYHGQHLSLYKDTAAKVVMSGGTLRENTLNELGIPWMGDQKYVGVIWVWDGNLEITGGNVEASGNSYAVFTQGDSSYYPSQTIINGGTFTGNRIGAIGMGGDYDDSKTTIYAGTFSGKDAVYAKAGSFDIRGGSFTGTDYALSTDSNSEINVFGGEFYGDASVYDGNVTTKTVKVIVGKSKDENQATNWDRKTPLNTYNYVKIGVLDENNRLQGNSYHTDTLPDSGPAIDVQGFTKASVVYSVDVEWGAMTFQYELSRYNPETHMTTSGRGWLVYDNVNNKVLGKVQSDINRVAVTNHSNAAVKAALSYNAVGDAGVTMGEFSKSENSDKEDFKSTVEPTSGLIILESADNGAGELGDGKATVGNMYFMPNDTPESNTIEQWTKIGKITVAISPAASTLAP